MEFSRPVILEWIAVPFSRGSSQPRNRKPGTPALQADSLPAELPGKPLKEDYIYENTKFGSNRCCCSVFKLCPIVFNPMDHSLPGSSIYGVFQAWILQWAVISFSRVHPNRLFLTNLSLTLTLKQSIFFFLLLKLIFDVIYEIYIAFSFVIL